MTDAQHAPCWMAKQPPCFILLGRTGDIIQVLPCFMDIYQRTGFKPRVITTNEYGSVLEGVSYVEPILFHGHWWKDVPRAKQMAQAEFGGGTVVQFWQEPPKHDDMIGFPGRNWTTLQCHGHEHGVNMALDPNYGASMARRCGFTFEEWRKLTLIFDRRHCAREEALCQLFLHNRLPTLLVNFHGISSPFAHTAEVLALIRRMSPALHVLNIGDKRVHRIYDLLGVYDRAVGLVTIDTATLHLAQASNIPYLAFTVDGWTSSVPKGNCTMEIKYSQVKKRMGDIKDWLKTL